MAQENLIDNVFFPCNTFILVVRKIVLCLSIDGDLESAEYDKSNSPIVTYLTATLDVRTWHLLNKHKKQAGFVGGSLQSGVTNLSEVGSAE